MHEETQKYYDEFAKVYEAHRHEGYHLMLDELEVEVLRPFATGKSVLEAGCGTGLILERIAKIASEAQGVDLSPGMLELAKRRGLNCQVSDLSTLPFEDNTFDCVYSFKVLAHVPDIRNALWELARVTKPGGHMVLEFYNPYSLRGLVKRLKPATTITEQTDDEQVYTRYDSLNTIRTYLPVDVELEDTRGIRILTPVAAAHRVPVLKTLLRQGEEKLLNSPLKNLAGFLVVILRKKG